MFIVETVPAVTNADNVFDSVCLRSHDKTKTTETKITKLGTVIVRHNINIMSKGQSSRSQGGSQCKKVIEWLA